MTTIIIKAQEAQDTLLFKTHVLQSDFPKQGDYELILQDVKNERQYITRKLQQGIPTKQLINQAWSVGLVVVNT